MQHYSITFEKHWRKDMSKRFGLLVIGGLLALVNPALAHDAHEHGVARLNVSVDGQEVEIELETPLANVISFEHAPETEAQREEVRAMAALLHRADSLFILPAEAQCRLNKVSLESEVLNDGLLSPAASPRAETADKNEHAPDGDEHGEKHGDLDMEVSFICRNPEKLNSLRVDLFRAFPNLREVEARMVTPKRQSAAELIPDSNMLRW